VSEPFRVLIVRLATPWLQRLDGGKVLAAIGARVDELVARASAAVKLRFPNVGTDTSLGYLGRERRIRRGPGESAASYARRQRRWLESHRVRGNAFELVRQLWAFHKAELDPRIDVVSTSGQRHWIAAGVDDGEAAGAIAHDEITWEPHPATYEAALPIVANVLAGATEVRPTSTSTFASATEDAPFPARITNGVDTEDVVVVGTATSPDRLLLRAPLEHAYAAGPSSIARLHYEWAHIWVFLYVDEAPSVVATLVTHAGDVIVTDVGDEIVVVTDISSGGELASEAAETFCAIPREWSAGHIPYVTVVLLYGEGLVLGYPVPVATLGDGHVLGADTPVVLIAE
jgi:hypothetical protein